MLKSFFSRPNIFVRLLVVLIFAGGLVFAGTYDGFVVETQTESCCGGMDVIPTEEPVAHPEASGCCGGTTHALLADGTAAQSKIKENPEEPTPGPAVVCSRNECDTSDCHGGACTSGCTTVTRCDKCKCQGTQCPSSSRLCSGHGSCSSKCTKKKASSS